MLYVTTIGTKALVPAAYGFSGKVSGEVIAIGSVPGVNTFRKYKFHESGTAVVVIKSGEGDVIKNPSFAKPTF